MACGRVGHLPESSNELQAAIDQQNALRSCSQDWWMAPQHKAKCHAPFELIKPKNHKTSDGSLVSVQIRACPYLKQNVTLGVFYIGTSAFGGTCAHDLLLEQVWGAEFTESFFLTSAWGNHLTVAAFALQSSQSPCLFARNALSLTYYINNVLALPIW